MAGLQPYNLSATNIKMFVQCLLKYWFQYIKKEKGLEDSIQLRFGSTVHAAMEELGKRLQAGEPLTAELCEEVAQNVPKHAAENQIGDTELIKEGQQFVRDRLFRHNPNYRVVATEQNFMKRNLTTNTGVPLTGVIDLLLEMAPTTGLVLDYKTSRRADSIAEAKTDVQLSMYDLMISKVYPQYTYVWLVLDFLRSEPVISERSLVERQNFEAWLNQLWIKMGGMKEKDVYPSINEYCPWCKFKHLCTAYEDVLKKDLTVKPIMAIVTPEEFTQEWKLAKALEKIAAGRIDELKNWADSRVANEGVVKFEDDKTIVSWGQSSRKFYDSSKLVGHLPVGDLPRLINFKNAELENYANSRPDLKPVIERAARTTPGAPRLTTRNK
jgi:RecB family exonuclease